MTTGVGTHAPFPHSLTALQVYLSTAYGLVVEKNKQWRQQGPNCIAISHYDLMSDAAENAAQFFGAQRGRLCYHMRILEP